jgi:hypothetical protein
MPEKSGRAYLRDLPEAEFHLLDAGHWPLETHLDEVVDLMRDFLERVHAAGEDDGQRSNAAGNRQDLARSHPARSG